MRALFLSIKLFLKQMDNSIRGVPKTQKVWQNNRLTVLQLSNLVLYDNEFMVSFRKCYCIIRIRKQKNRVDAGPAATR
jgi:hypothetical protein